MRHSCERMFVRTFVALLTTTVMLSPSFAQEKPGDEIRKRIILLEEKVAGYEKPLSWEAKCRDYRLALAELKLEKARLLQSAYLEGRASAEVAAAEELARGLGTPLRDYDKPGRHELAYLSPIDLSPEPFLVYVPTAYDGKKPAPLLIFLHGYDPFIDKCNWTETMYAPEMEELAEKNGFLVAMPYARSNTEFMGVGEVEVLNMLRLVKELYKVDERRVIMSGASMGGSGSYAICCHYPHLFAGVFTITARIDYYMWVGVKREDLPRFKQIQTDLDYARSMLGNLLHVPVFLFHGAEDRRPYPEVEQSRLMFQLLGGMRQSVTYHEFQGRGHYIWGESFSHPDLAPWLREREVPALPKTVHYSTMSPKYNRAYWVEIEEMAEWGKQASVEGSVVDPRHIVLKTSNVARLALRSRECGIEANAPVTVTLDGVGHTIMPDAAGLLRVPPRANAPPQTGIAKTPDLCGPMRDAYCSRFLIVRGTAGTAEETAVERERAEEAAREWVGFTQGRAYAKTDDAVTDDEMRSCNLILYGSPFTNSLVAKIAPQLPIKIEPAAYVIGDRRVPRKGTSLMMIYPNPLNRSRYVVICDGPKWGGALSINHKLDLVPDFIIFVQDVSTDGTAYPYLLDVCGTNQHVCAGYFDNHWQLSKELTWWADIPALTAGEH